MHCPTFIARAALALTCALLFMSCALFSVAPQPVPAAGTPAADTPTAVETPVSSAAAAASEPAATFTPLPSSTPGRRATRTPWVTATQPPTPTATPTTADTNRLSSPVDGMLLLFVPEGEFLMGSDEAAYEHPARTYWLDAFWIDQTEVTAGMYMQCFKAGGCAHPKNLPDSMLNDPNFQRMPITNLTYKDAVSYCAWAGRRLPTSAEWEKAARGTDSRQYPWGNQPMDETRCNSNENDYRTTGSYPEGASPYGALDMCGNVNEMVSDYYGYYWEMNEPYKNPTGPASGTMKVTRGGTHLFSETPDYYTWGRDWLAEGSWAGDTGFRCAVSDKDLMK